MKPTVMVALLAVTALPGCLDPGSNVGGDEGPVAGDDWQFDPNGQAGESQPQPVVIAGPEGGPTLPGDVEFTIEIPVNLTDVEYRIDVMPGSFWTVSMQGPGCGNRLFGIGGTAPDTMYVLGTCLNLPKGNQTMTVELLHPVAYYSVQFTGMSRP